MRLRWRRVTIQDYARACSANETVKFQSMVDFFDADRQKSITERIFADDSLREVYTRVQN